MTDQKLKNIIFTSVFFKSILDDGRLGGEYCWIRKNVRILEVRSIENIVYKMIVKLLYCVLHDIVHRLNHGLYIFYRPYYVIHCQLK